MSPPAFSRYPKSAASTANDESPHPNTVKFRRNMLAQNGLINNVKLRSIANTLPRYENLFYGYDKVFWVDGMWLSYPIVLCVGYAKGSLWACPDGNVIREKRTPTDLSIFWTAHTAVDTPLAPASRTPTPFDRFSVLRDGLTTPMGAEAHALVRYYTTLRAQDSDLTKFSMEFPDSAVLLNVLRLLAPERARPVVPDRVTETIEIEKHSTTEGVTNHPPPISAAVEILEHEEAVSSENTGRAQGGSAAASCKVIKVASGESPTPLVQAVHQKVSSPPSMAWPAKIVEADADEADSKYKEDLAALLQRKADIQAKIEARHNSAEAEDRKARVMLHWGEHRVKDVRAYMDEAARLRALARDDQKEIDAIDKHLATPLNVTQLTESLQQTKRDHPTPG